MPRPDGIPLAPRRRLLVSVRSEDEVEAAIAGGAGVIDVKEPLRGPMGRADPEVAQSVVRAVAGRAPVTVAAGELVDRCGDGQDATPEPLLTTPGPAVVKLGLAGCGADDGWRRWLAASAASTSGQRHVAPVMYADSRGAESPDPPMVIDTAAELGLPWIVLDTFDKTARSLFDTLTPGAVGELVAEAHQRGLRIAVAGSLDRVGVGLAAKIGADLVGVRGAACSGNRRASVSRAAVTELSQAVDEAMQSHAAASRAPRGRSCREKI